MKKIVCLGTSLRMVVQKNMIILFMKDGPDS